MVENPIKDRLIGWMIVYEDEYGEDCWRCKESENRRLRCRWRIRWKIDWSYDEWLNDWWINQRERERETMRKREGRGEEEEEEEEDIAVGMSHGRYESHWPVKISFRAGHNILGGAAHLGHLPLHTQYLCTWYLTSRSRVQYCVSNSYDIFPRKRQSHVRATSEGRFEIWHELRQS